jgi:hypothetical protein
MCDSMEDSYEIENEKAMAPTSMRIKQNTRSGIVTPLMSPKPTVVKVVSTKYIDAIYTS